MSHTRPKNSCLGKQLPELTNLVVRLHAEILDLGKKTIEKVIEIGQAILQAQPHVPHGDYIAWAERYVGSDDTARNYAAVAEVDAWSKSKSRTVRNFKNLTEAYRFAHNEIAQRKASERRRKRKAPAKQRRCKSVRKRLAGIPITSKVAAIAYKAETSATQKARLKGVRSFSRIDIGPVQPTHQAIFSALQNAQMLDSLRTCLAQEPSQLVIVVELEAPNA